ncbi:MAG: hypothetical protein AB4352_25745 [Hormoscilla sp.]
MKLYKTLFCSPTGVGRPRPRSPDARSNYAIVWYEMGRSPFSPL